MASSAAHRRQRRSHDIWPGFVDAISTLLIIIIFLLMVFFLAQHFLSMTLTGRDEALEQLNRQVAELADLLALERTANVDLRDTLSQISAQLQSSTAARDALASQLSELLPERDSLAARLESRTAELESVTARLAASEAEREMLAAELEGTAGRAESAAAALEEAQRLVEADRETITAQLRELAQLRRDIEALRVVRGALEQQVAEMAGALQAQEEAATAARDRSKELEARLASEEERTALAQRDIEDKETELRRLYLRLEESGTALDEEKQMSAEARRQVELLNQQVAALRQQLARLATALEASEAEAREQNVRIADLGRRLNMALATKVEELAGYRSEFFGRLREVLGERQDIRIVGDRFVFQSEVLFPSGSASLTDGGRTQIGRLARTLNEIRPKIPDDLNWILRVDGHTDRVPIFTAQFPSNWELSTARAIEVVRHLIREGVPAERLAATGFGEFHPLDARDDEIAYRRNRRIEFKLTER